MGAAYWNAKSVVCWLFKVVLIHHNHNDHYHYPHHDYDHDTMNIMIILSMINALEHCTFLLSHCSTSFDQSYLRMLYSWVYQKSGQI